MGNVLWKRKTYLSQVIAQTQSNARYDEAAKKLLGNKIVLAHILKACAAEYGACTVDEIAERYIQGEPQIGVVGVHKDESNVEAQNRFRPGYPIIKRGIYYGGRMLSAQYGLVFTNAEYDKICKVYSIWICTNPPKEFQNTITRYAIQPECLVGQAVERKENYDLLSVVMVCLGEPEMEGYTGLLEFLEVLLSQDRTADEKRNILEDKFHVPMTEQFESEVQEMCNLSEGVYEKGLERGIERGIECVALNMIRADKPFDEIEILTGISHEDLIRLADEMCEKV